MIQARPRGEIRTDAFRHDSPLGQWTVTTLAPDPLLRGIVRQLWYGEGRVAYSRDRLLPRAHSYLFINLGPPQYVIAADRSAPRAAFTDVWFSGISTCPIDTEAPHGSAVLGVAFNTTGAARLLPWRQSELANRTGPLADVLGSEPLRLRERLLQTTNITDRLMLVEQWLIEKCYTGRSIHPLVHWATRRLTDANGTVRAEVLAREAGCSRKHLSALFNREVGLTPKALGRVLRFQRALREIEHASPNSWSELAYGCGYYDQSHLINDFREFTGMPPERFSRHAMPDSNSIVLK